MPNLHTLSRKLPRLFCTAFAHSKPHKPAPSIPRKASHKSILLCIYILYNNAEKGLPLFHSYTSHHCTVSYHHIVLNTKSPTPLFIYTQRTLIFRILHSWKTYNSCFTRRSIRQNRRASIFSFSQRWKTLFFFTAERHLFLYFPTDDRYNLAFLHAITYVCIIIHHIFC